MFKQQSQSLNQNNKENNNSLSNNMRGEEDILHNKVLQVNNNINNIVQSTKNTKNIPQGFFEGDKVSQESNSQAAHNFNSQGGQKYSSSTIAQQLLNDVRALAAQNQKTEQNLRELQQKINIQKQKRNGILITESSNNNKENDQSYSKPTRNHSQSITIATTIPKPLIQGNTPSICQSLNTQVNGNHEQLKINRHSHPLPKSLSLPIHKDPIKEIAKNEQQQQPQEEKDVIQKVEEIKQVEAPPKKFRDEKLGPISTHQARVLINETYSLDIINHLKATEAKTVPKNCLLKHSITEYLRVKMIDWMIEITKSYKCSEETFFMSVRIMDHFLEKSKKVKKMEDLHLIGVTCMFIACKFEETYPISLSIIQERIAHNKISESEIKLMEAEILQALEFNLLGTSPYDIAMQTLTVSGYQEKFNTQEFEYGHKICIYLSKMVLYDYEFNKSTPYSLLAASVIYIIFKIFQQITPEFAAEQQIKGILQILKISSKDLVKTSTRILLIAENFEQFFPNLESLKKFNGFEMKKNDTLTQNSLL